VVGSRRRRARGGARPLPRRVGGGDELNAPADDGDAGTNADLAARVRRLEDLLEIHQLFVDYGLALDAGDFDTYASLFARDGEVLLGPMGRAKGRDEIRALMSGIQGGVGSSFHIISSPQVRLDGDTASSEVMWSVVRLDDDGQARLSMLGRHRDDLVREDGRWVFARRRGFVDIPSMMPDRGRAAG
jgi:uncharacterized protein (TIGR02246 family)